jgi:GAF domain-containing protein
LPLFSVMRRGQPPVTVQADNWIVAMGEGIPKLAGDVAIDRLACEMLQNGTVIARDVRSGQGYVILPLAEGAQRPDLEDLTQQAEEETTGPLESFGEESDDEDEDQENALDQALKGLEGTSQATDAWQLAIELLCAEVPCEAGTAVEATPRAGLLFSAVIGPHAPKLRALRLPYGAGFVGVCVSSGIALRVSDVEKDQRHYVAVDEATGFQTRSVLCAPVVADGVCFGCLELINAESGRFTRRDADLAQRVVTSLSARLVRAGVRGRPLS